VTAKDKAHALRCVTYEALILAASLQRLCKSAKQRCSNQSDLPFDLDDQIALEAALLKTRSLYDFLSPSRGRADRDDIVITDFGEPVWEPSDDVKKHKRSAHKWSLHLTWQRVERSPAEPRRPKPDEVYGVGRQVLKQAKKRIDKLAQRGELPLCKTGQRYRRTLDKIMKAF